MNWFVLDWESIYQIMFLIPRVLKSSLCSTVRIPNRHSLFWCLLDFMQYVNIIWLWHLFFHLLNLIFFLCKCSLLFWWIGDGPVKSPKFKGEGILFVASVGDGDEVRRLGMGTGMVNPAPYPTHFHPYLPPCVRLPKNLTPLAEKSQPLLKDAKICSTQIMVRKSVWKKCTCLFRRKNIQKTNKLSEKHLLPPLPNDVATRRNWTTIFRFPHHSLSLYFLSIPHSSSPHLGGKPPPLPP